MHNYDATMQAIAIFNHSRGMKFGARRMTISTVGIIPMIKRFTSEHCGVNLAISLHAATNDLRDTLIPVNRRYPIDELITACQNYIRQTGRRITFEWALIDGVNDGLDQARQLAQLLEGMICHVNLIPLNPIDHYRVAASSRKIAEAFRDLLQSRGIPCSLRVRRGMDINAGCGQLASRIPKLE